MSAPIFPIARSRGLVAQESDSELLIYDLNADRAHCLNTTVAAVWRLCDGTRSPTEISAAVGEILRQDVPEDLVWLALEQLSEQNLLEGNVGPRENGISRRELIRRIGLATMVALPVVASLAVPTSALAATSCTCTGQLSCVSQTGCPPYCNQRTSLCVATV